MGSVKEEEHMAEASDYTGNGAAVVFSGDAGGGVWRTRLAIASFVEVGVQRDRMFVLGPGWDDPLAFEAC